jgi:hypothetical protein
VDTEFHAGVDSMLVFTPEVKAESYLKITVLTAQDQGRIADSST